MTRQLEGRICVVTGASSGIGAAIARTFAAQGGAVVGFARRFAAPSIDALPAAGQVLEVGLDVTREGDVDARFSELAQVDVLVNCAGVGSFGLLADSAVADLRAMLEVHIVGTFLCCRAALRSMRERNTGHIINIGSTAVTSTFAACSGYAAAKAGQMALSRVLREECRAHDVRVTSLSPGAVDTPIWDEREGFDRSKMLAPDDLAGLVVDIVARPSLSVDDILVLPPAGNL